MLHRGEVVRHGGVPPCGVSDEFKGDSMVDGILVGVAARGDVEGQGGAVPEG